MQPEILQPNIILHYTKEADLKNPLLGRPHEKSNGNLPKSPYTTFPTDQFKKKYSMFYDSR